MLSATEVAPASRTAAGSFNLFGVRFAAVQIPDVIEFMEGWIAAREGTHVICVSNVHSTVECQHNREFKDVLNASFNVPDGMPVVWYGRAHGHRNLERRVYGPELFQEFCRATDRKAYRHFFYGGAPGVPETVATELKARFPGLQVAGMYSPPFRPLSVEEDVQAVDLINRANPDVLWVGLGCPKQETWMHTHRGRLKVPVIVGVGQAFNIHAGTLRQAPLWMREHGLEWLFRLLLEPRRLWKRYLVYNTQFLYLLTLESLHLRKFDAK